MNLSYTGVLFSFLITLGITGYKIVNPPPPAPRGQDNSTHE
jgi:hypothetical protein